VQQVVWNLLSNAIKFTPPGGRVELSLSGDGSARIIRVVDTGIGIEPRFLPHVFEQFRQADDSTRRQHSGLGLGLSIVKHLVQLHGGVVEASSAGLGQGAAFTVRLPMARMLDEQTLGDEAVMASLNGGDDADARSESVILDGIRVLLVEDEADSRYIVSRILTAAGAIVTAVGSASEAMEILSNVAEGVDVLVSDLGMPNEDGFDLIRQVRSGGHEARDLPAIALTAFAGKNEQRRALLAGFQVHISKPVNAGDLTAAIASLAGRAAG
jgi:two-component system CheB/CheR fusion protein